MKDENVKEPLLEEFLERRRKYKQIVERLNKLASVANEAKPTWEEIYSIITKKI